MGKSTISMAIFHCFLYVHQRVIGKKSFFPLTGEGLPATQSLPRLYIAPLMRWRARRRASCLRQCSSRYGWIGGKDGGHLEDFLGINWRCSFCGKIWKKTVGKIWRMFLGQVWMFILWDFLSHRGCASNCYCLVFFWCFDFAFVSCFFPDVFCCRVSLVFCSFWLLPSVSLRHLPSCLFSPLAISACLRACRWPLFFQFCWSCPRFLVIAALCLWFPSLWHFACAEFRNKRPARQSKLKICMSPCSAATS